VACSCDSTAWRQRGSDSHGERGGAPPLLPPAAPSLLLPSSM
jgi:hypothetical protein